MGEAATSKPTGSKPTGSRTAGSGRRSPTGSHGPGEVSAGEPAVAESGAPGDGPLGTKRREILDFIAAQIRERGYPPSVREIGEAVGLTSSSTVHAHLATLQRQGYLRRDPTKPRAIEVRYDPSSGAAIASRPVRHVPLVGRVAAGTDVLAEENLEELLPLPQDFTGHGQLFMLEVRGDSMTGAGILDGDHVVVRQQPTAERGDIVVAGIPGDEATVKRLARKGRRVVLEPENPAYEVIELDADDVTIYGRVVTLLRRV